LFRPVTVHESVTVVHVAAPGDDVTVYAVIAAPPFDWGADQLTVTWPPPGTPLTESGAVGTVLGVIAALVALGPVPMLLTAATANVTGVPLVSPLHAAEVPVTTQLPPAGDGVTVYPVIAVVPGAGAVHVTVADEFPGTASTFVGADGADGSKSNTVSVTVDPTRVPTRSASTENVSAW
jgi:hypothetical protein